MISKIVFGGGPENDDLPYEFLCKCCHFVSRGRGDHWMARDTSGQGFDGGGDGAKHEKMLYRPLAPGGQRDIALVICMSAQTLCSHMSALVYY